MTIDLVLFALRILAGVALLTFLLALFVLLWRDYRATLRQNRAHRRSYGRLVALARVDDLIAPTGEAHPLLPLTTLGRAPTNTIIIADHFASSEHALVSLNEGQWWLEDRKSRNGTQLNGEVIDTPVIVTDGDVISIGHASYRLELD